jgi:flagellar biosynthesis/type III secretory pathway M-ring protein FliF/YscJ
MLNGLSHAGVSDAVVRFLSADEKPQFDPNSVTPGVIGFVATFLVMAVVVLLVTDMVRRVRRTQYRAEVNERLDAEAAELAEQDPGSQDGSPGTSDDRGPV